VTGIAVECASSSGGKTIGPPAAGCVISAGRRSSSFPYARTLPAERRIRSRTSSNRTGDVRSSLRKKIGELGPNGQADPLLVSRRGRLVGSAQNDQDVLSFAGGHGEPSLRSASGLAKSRCVPRSVAFGRSDRYGRRTRRKTPMSAAAAPTVVRTFWGVQVRTAGPNDRAIDRSSDLSCDSLVLPVHRYLLDSPCAGDLYAPARSCAPTPKAESQAVACVRWSDGLRWLVFSEAARGPPDDHPEDPKHAWIVRMLADPAAPCAHHAVRHDRQEGRGIKNSAHHSRFRRGDGRPSRGNRRKDASTSGAHASTPSNPEAVDEPSSTRAAESGLRASHPQGVGPPRWRRRAAARQVLRLTAGSVATAPSDGPSVSIPLGYRRRIIVRTGLSDRHHASDHRDASHDRPTRSVAWCVAAPPAPAGLLSPDDGLTRIIIGQDRPACQAGRPEGLPHGIAHVEGRGGKRVAVRVGLPLHDERRCCSVSRF
jgi:hypothetical protein